MDGTTVSLNPALLGLDSRKGIYEAICRLMDAQRRATALRANLMAAYDQIAGILKGQEIVFMLRNKWGLSKKDAQKLYYDLRNPGEGPGEGSEGNNPNQSKQPETVDDKISMIMDYMKDTSAKLDGIDRDIAHLKKQVEEILKRM